MRFSFESVNATDYDELRPTYAPEAIRWVAERARLEPGTLVVDLAAGTGQLSRRFVRLGVRVVAVEPAANMRAVLATNLPDVTAVPGTAEAIPLGDGEADAVVVGNAFHHFDAEDAFAEIRRVLRPGGALALFWARTDEHADGLRLGIREIDEVVERERGVITGRRGVLRVVRAARARRGVHDARTAFVPDHANDRLGAARRPVRDVERHRVSARTAARPAPGTDRRARGRSPGDARAR